MCNYTLNTWHLNLNRNYKGGVHSLINLTVTHVHLKKKKKLFTP